LRTLAIVLAAITYCGAVVYGDVMFIQTMHDVFPSGLMGTLATAGAVMTAVSAITLPIALHFWFAPGMQFIWGVIFWALDIVALGLNAILAYGIATGAADPWLLQWRAISPATPLLAVIGWGIAFLLDPAHKLRHAQAELEADQLDIYAEQLRQAARGDDVAEEITAGARAAARQAVGQLTGARLPQLARPAAPAQPPAEIPAPAPVQIPLPSPQEAMHGVNGHTPDPEGPARPKRRP
jgi:hypothetical protein